MKLSVIIVNYNVKYFLEQCLYSVIKATRETEAEIIVVDNNSVDGSAQLIGEKFPQIKFVQNRENVGFSKANNQAIKISRGEYVLLLNPDTVVEEDTFKKTLSYMDENPDAGALGVKMIDGKGSFLPESKRGLPTPWVAFYKMFGISKLFPKSRKFGTYHLSYLNENEIHEVDVLAGAFMLLRRSVLDKTGLLDEAFFMYGEDIDLSYRIQQAGYKNIYFPETTIIHYKGESTKKGSLNYVKVFYNAMIIFARKHYSGNKAGMLAFIIHIAVWFRALLSVLKRLFSKLFAPLLDAIIIFLGFLVITPFWEQIRFDDGYYPPEFLQFVVPVYIVFYLMGILLSGGYKKPVSLYRLIRGIVWGLVAILLVYSLVDEEFRFSRALILLGTAWAGFLITASRITLHALRVNGYRLNFSKTRRIAIVGHSKEASRVKEILKDSVTHSETMGFIAIDKTDKGSDYMGHLEQLTEIIRINRLDEIIFCAENISSAEIIRSMLSLSRLNIDYKIAPPESLSIIGSNSIHTAGDLYVVNINAISRPSNRIIKRWLDLKISFLLLIFSPLLIWWYGNKGSFFKNIFRTIGGAISWIGYLPKEGTYENLPEIKKGVLNPSVIVPEVRLDNEKIARLNMLYAKDYSLLTDIEILFKGWKKLDNG